MLTSYLHSNLTEEEYINSITLRYDGKIPVWFTQGKNWYDNGKALGFMMGKEHYIGLEYKELLYKLLKSLNKQADGTMNANREEVNSLYHEVNNMYSNVKPFVPDREVQTAWKQSEHKELGLYGWDNSMNNNPILTYRIIHTNTKKLKEQWLIGKFKCERLIYYTTDEQEFMALTIEKMNLNLNYKIIEGRPPEKVSVVKKYRETEHLKFLMEKWEDVYDWEWSEIIEQSKRELPTTIS